MGGNSEENEDRRKASAASSLARRRVPYAGNILNSPVMQLQRSLAAQQALLKPTFSFPNLSAGFSSPGFSASEALRRQTALRDSALCEIRSGLVSSAFALSTAHNRLLADIHAITPTAGLTKSLRDAIRAASVLPQIVSGRVLPEIGSIMVAREHIASCVRSQMDRMADTTRLVSHDMVSSVRAAIEAKAAISQQLKLIQQATSVSRVPSLSAFQAMGVRLEALRLSELERLAKEVSAADAPFPVWSAEEGAVAADRLQAELTGIADAEDLSIEDQLNYLIEWTQRQDNEQFKQVMIAVIISLLANLIFS